MKEKLTKRQLLELLEKDHWVVYYAERGQVTELEEIDELGAARSEMIRRPI